MQYCINHPEEMSKLSKLRAQITEVKGIMMDNIEKVCGLMFILPANPQMHCCAYANCLYLGSEHSCLLLC